MSGDNEGSIGDLLLISDELLIYALPIPPLSGPNPQLGAAVRQPGDRMEVINTFFKNKNFLLLTIFS